jgi:hypothetical protein
LLVKEASGSGGTISGSSRNLQLGIHFAKIATIFTKIIIVLPCFAKIFGIHKNTKEDPWSRHWAPSMVSGGRRVEK